MLPASVVKTTGARKIRPAHAPVTMRPLFNQEFLFLKCARDYRTARVVVVAAATVVCARGSFSVTDSRNNTDNNIHDITV